MHYLYLLHPPDFFQGPNDPWGQPLRHLLPGTDFQRPSELHRARRNHNHKPVAKLFPFNISNLPGSFLLHSLHPKGNAWIALNDELCGALPTTVVRRSPSPLGGGPAPFARRNSLQLPGPQFSGELTDLENFRPHHSAPLAALTPTSTGLPDSGIAITTSRQPLCLRSSSIHGDGMTNLEEYLAGTAPTTRKAASGSPPPSDKRPLAPPSHSNPRRAYACPNKPIPSATLGKHSGFPPELTTTRK